MINKVTLIGRLGGDTEIRENKSGKPFTKLNIATSSGYKDASGQWQETTYWHSVLANWRVEAKKGDTVYIEGELGYYTGSDNVKHAQVKAYAVKVLSGSSAGKKQQQNENNDDLGGDLPF